MNQSQRHRGPCSISDEWTYRGLRTIILENDLLRIVVLVDKGSDIVEFRYKPRDMDFLLQMPGGVRDPRSSTPSSYNANTFIDYYSGGWNEILPNGGPGATYKGAEFGQHGEISLIPWQYQILENSEQRVAVRLSVRPLRTPFFLEKTLTLEAGRPMLTIDEVLTNEAGESMHLMWGHHIAFGRPFLEEGAIIDAPNCRFRVHGAMPDYEPRRFQPDSDTDWPLVPAPDGTQANASEVPAYGAAQAQEMAYLTGYDEGWYAITNPKRNVGFGISFDPKLFRYVWYWQQLGDIAKGYPWWGRLHATALEPWTSYPTSGLSEAIKNGSALLMQSGEQIRTTLKAVAYHDLTRVSAITQDGEVKG